MMNKRRSIISCIALIVAWEAAAVRAAARDPHCVGVCWFFYRDQPLTGRGPGRGAKLVFGEHFAFGAIDELDRPKRELVHRMRQANLWAARWRLEATSTAPAVETRPGSSVGDR
jgi:hypothetical protein